MDKTVDDDRATQLIDDPTLDRIINEVHRPFKGNRNALRHDLLNCCQKYTIASGPGSSGTNKRQVNRLTSISYHAKKLVELLQEDDGDLGLIRHTWPKRPDCPAYPLEQLGLLEAVLNHVSGTSSVAKIYNRNTFEGEKAQALTRWAEHLAALIEGRKSNITPLKRGEDDASER
jgi:hypothetical protein